MAGRREFLCYTDGACKAAHGGAGGWGFVIEPPDASPIEAHGSALGTLAKVMEYRAVAEALSALPDHVTAVVLSDNASLIENLGKKLDAWVDAGFSKVDPDVVESVRRIAQARSEKELDLRWQWVRSHNGNRGNERADALAAQGAREAKAAHDARGTKGR